MPSEFDRWAKVSQLSPSNALEAITNPDRREKREYEGVVLEATTKRVTKTTPPIIVLGILSKMPGETDARPSLVLKVYESFHKDAATMSPFDLLREIVETFGIPTSLGQARKKLFLTETVSVPGPRSGISTSPNTHLIFTDISRYARDEKEQRCALMFGLDVDEYNKYLRDAKRMSN